MSAAAGRFDQVWLTNFPSPAACRFVTAEDVMAIALKAHLAAVRQQSPPPGESWMDEGCAWGGPEDFYASLLSEIEQRLRARAIERGHLALVPWTSEQYAEEAEWQAELSGAGRSPAIEGQGCPALLPAVGPATTASRDVDITIPANPLFAASGMQKLPEVTPADTLDSKGSKLEC